MIFDVLVCDLLIMMLCCVMCECLFVVLVCVLSDDCVCV